MKAPDAVLLDEADQVATVLHPIEPGMTVMIAAPKHYLRIIATETIPLFHKIAIQPLSKGSDVLKYGDSIGVLITDVDEGAHVHIHNLHSRRAVRTD
ncbi:MAG: UxaA family hydrolase [Geminicoccaceae bacterium]